MTEQYKNIFSPFTLNKLKLRNRIIFPPMAFSFDHHSGETSEKTIETYSRIIRGGASMVIPVTMFADPFEQKPKWHRALPYSKAKYDPVRAGNRMRWTDMHWSEEYNQRLFDLTEAVHLNGGKICAALANGVYGWAQNYMRANPNEKMLGFGLFNKLTLGEIEAIIEEFVNVASWLKASDFDAIEMNMTALPDFFTMPQFNKREDKYGGDFDGRLQFVKELTQATRNAVGKDFPIIYMFDPDHFTQGLRTLEDGVAIAKKVAEFGVDAIRARGGGWAKVEYEIPNMYLPEGVDIHLAEEIKKVVDIPVIAGGKLGNPDLAENLLKEGKADLVAIGRALIADPDWPNKVRTGNADRVRKCISCNIGCLGRVTQVPRKLSRCSVNPLFGNEEKFKGIGPAAQKKKVVIVGAGPAGMSAALCACQRDHCVVLFEKSSKLGGGGQFNLSTIPPFKQETHYISEYYEREFAELNNLRIELNANADAAEVMKAMPDAVIIATGAGPMVPGISGSDDQQVLTYEDVLLDKKKVGSHAVIIGGGNVGCETATYLIKKGVKVTILEMCFRLLDNVETSTRNTLLKELKEGEAEMIESAIVSSISETEVTYVKEGKDCSIKADTIVFAVGSKSDDKLYYDLCDKVTNLHIVGDAKDPRQIMHAVSEGYYAAYYL
jgi:2,4-dienoyl-CoA reductase-like NADH-dependent reductase (Old Yellow Enzyme family)/thioredoxin reductase